MSSPVDNTPPGEGAADPAAAQATDSGGGADASAPGEAPARSHSSSSSSSSSGSDSDGDGGEDLDAQLAQITAALAEAQEKQEAAIREEAAAKDLLRKKAISNAQEEAAVLEASEAAKEERARDRAQASAARARGNVDGVLDEDASQPAEGGGDRLAAGPTATDRLKMIEAAKEAEEKAKAKKEWKKAIKNPLKMAAMLAAKQKEREERFSNVSRPLWMKAKSRTALLAGAIAGVQEMSAERFEQVRSAILIQKHTRRLLTQRRMGIEPGATLLDEHTRQLVQTKLAEKKLADALAKLKPESQRAVAKLGTQLANMAKEVVYNNAAEHLLLCIGDKEMANLVANWGLDGSKLRPIHNAAKFKNRKLAKFILNRGAETNLRDIDGMTPLHYSVVPPFVISAEARAKVLVDADSTVKECKETCKLLVERGALLSIPNNLGRSPLHEATYECIRHINFFHINTNDLEAAAFAQCCFVLMEFLIEQGAPLDCKDLDKNSLLCTCAIIGGPGGVDVAGWLIDRGGDVEWENGEGKTPFFLALEHGQGDVASLLRDSGADQNATDQYDVTPKENAQFNNRLTTLLYCENWPKDYFDFLKESKSWTGCDAHKGIQRVDRGLTATDKKQLADLEYLFRTTEWQWGYARPVAFMEHYNPAHRDYESPFDILDFNALGSLLYYDMMWVQMDDDGRAMEEQLKSDCALFFVPVARTSWRCTWTGRLIGSSMADEWVMPGDLRPTQSFQAHERGITGLVSIASGMDGGRSVLASIAGDNSVKLWYGPSMEPTGELQGHVDTVTCMSSSSSFVFTGSTDRTVRQWSLLDNTRCVAVLRGHDDAITALSADTPSEWLVSGSHDGSLRVWHLRSKVCMAIFKCDKGVASVAAGGYPRCIVLDEHRSVIFCGLQTGDIQLWDLHQNLVPMKRPSLTNRTKPKLLLPGKPADILMSARKNVDVQRSQLVSVSHDVFDTWTQVKPDSETLMVPGCTYWFELTLKNYGLPLTDLIVKDLLETGMTYAGCYPVGASTYVEKTFNGRAAVHWKISSLPLAKEARLKVFITADIQGKYARATRLLPGDGLACQKLAVIRHQLHCGFQGGDVTKLTIKHGGHAIKLAKLFATPAEDEDPWLPQKLKCDMARLRNCCRNVFCCPCLRSKKVQPAVAGVKKIIASITKTHYYHKMTDKQGDLERTVMITGLDGDKSWTAFAIGKALHAIRGGKLVTNYHPITIRVLHVSKGTLAIGYSDGAIRIWPILPPTVWEAQDMLVVLALDLLHAVLVLVMLVFLWRSLPLLCRLCRRRKSGGKELRRLIIDNALGLLLDFWAIWLFLLYLMLLPRRKDIKRAWKLQISDCVPDEMELASEMPETIWTRMAAHWKYLDTLARFSTNRFGAIVSKFRTPVVKALYPGHSNQIVAVHLWGSSIYSLSPDGVMCEWRQGQLQAAKIWYGAPGATCFQIQPQGETLTTVWIGHEDGHIDVKSLKDGELVATQGYPERGSVTCMEAGQINGRKLVYSGWEDGKILNSSLSIPKGLLNIREVEISAELTGHLKAIGGMVLREEVIYSRSFGRVLGHSMVTSELKVVFNETDVDLCSALEFSKDVMFAAVGKNILCFDLVQSLHGKDAMGLNTITIQTGPGIEATARAGKLTNVLEGHLGQVTALKMYSENLFTSSDDGTVREWKSSYPWECEHVFDSQLNRVTQIVVCKGALYTALPDGLMQGWRLGEGFKIGKDNNIVGGKKLKKSTTETLGKLLRAAKASQKDMRDITFGPRSGRCVNIPLERPVEITNLQTFANPSVDDKVYIGMGRGDIWVLNAISGEVLFTYETGRHNSIGWLFLEIFAVGIYIFQMVGLGFCVDNTMWSYTGAALRDAMSSSVLRTRGYHAPMFLENFALAAALSCFYIFAVALQVNHNTIGNGFLRAQFCTQAHVQQGFAYLCNAAWLVCWMGTHALLIPTTRALAAAFDCTYDCWQGKHLIFCILAVLLLAAYVPLVSRMSRVHGNVLRLASGRWLSWSADFFRDDAVKFLTSFSVEPTKVWCMSFLVWVKVAMSILSATVKIPSLNAAILCTVCFFMMVVFLCTRPFKNGNGNLVFMGSFFAIGSSYTATFASAWFQDWRWDRPAILFLIACFPLLVGPIMLFNFKSVVKFTIQAAKAFCKLFECLSPETWRKRNRRKTLKAKFKMGAMGGGMLKGMLANIKANAPPGSQPEEPAVQLTGAQRLISRLGANSAIVASKKGGLGGPSGLLRLAGTMKKVRAAAPKPEPKVDHSHKGIQGRLRHNLKKVALVGVLGALGATDATVHSGEPVEEMMKCGECMGQPKAWGKQLRLIAKSLRKKLAKCCNAWGTSICKCGKGVGKRCAGCGRGCRDMFLNPKRCGRLVSKRCLGCKNYIKFVCLTLQAWFLSTTVGQFIVNIYTHASNWIRPKYERQRDKCRRWAERNCIIVKRAETRGAIDKSVPHFLEFWKGKEDDPASPEFLDFRPGSAGTDTTDPESGTNTDRTDRTSEPGEPGEPEPEISAEEAAAADAVRMLSGGGPMSLTAPGALTGLKDEGFPELPPLPESDTELSVVFGANETDDSKLDKLLAKALCLSHPGIDPEGAASMRDLAAIGRFTHQHYIDMWTKRLEGDSGVVISVATYKETRLNRETERAERTEKTAARKAAKAAKAERAAKRAAEGGRGSESEEETAEAAPTGPKEVWDIDGMKIDLNGDYKTGGQKWYLQDRARGAIKANLPIAGRPVNKLAKDAGRLWEGKEEEEAAAKKAAEEKETAARKARLAAAKKAKKGEKK